MKSMDEINGGSDLEHIQQAQQGSLDAFNILVLKYQDLLYNHAYALMGVRQSAEDATQESIVKAFQKINQFQGCSFRGWLLKIVTNTCFDKLRRLKQHPVTSLYITDENGEEIDTLAGLADPNISVMTMVEQGEFSKTLYQYVDELSDIYRSAITLIDLYEFDYREAAAILKIPMGTLKSRIARARFQMKEKIETSVEPSPNYIIHTTVRPSWNFTRSDQPLGRSDAQPGGLTLPVWGQKSEPRM